MLIVFRREDKSLYRKCEKCQYMVELRDDSKQYPKTVGIVCCADQTINMMCFEYMWALVRCNYKGAKTVIPIKADVEQVEEIRKVLNNLKRIGVKK